MKLHARWTDDCQGKKDYDGPIIEISTRYWPRGGGFHIFDGNNPQAGFRGNETRPEIQPSATSSVIIRHGERYDGDGGGNSTTLVSRDFRGETFEEIAPQVEAFAQGEMERIVTILQREYGVSHD